MSYDEITKSVQVQHGNNQYPAPQQPRGGMYDDGYAYDPYPVPNDPYMYRPPQQNANMQMLNALLDNQLKDPTQLDDIRQLIIIGINNVKRIPNIEMTVIKSLQRDWADIVEFNECQGTDAMVLSLMVEFLFEIASLGAYGGAELKGISTIGAMVTQKQIADQTVKYPQEPQTRKKIFGVI
jgi:hypothetical protein